MMQLLYPAEEMMEVEEGGGHGAEEGWLRGRRQLNSSSEEEQASGDEKEELAEEEEMEEVDLGPQFTFKSCIYCPLQAPDLTSLALHLVREHWYTVRERQAG